MRADEEPAGYVNLRAGCVLSRRQAAGVISARRELRGADEYVHDTASGAADQQHWM
jgi:hypothetical protein